MYSIRTHDAWGSVPVGEFSSLEEARQAFAAICDDPWYRLDGTVRGAELLGPDPDGQPRRLEWFAFS
ncbi:MAG: hypothetical protein RLZZ459_486 [Cyanobacteriota bacterium]|jgi:hypothetical protein